MCGIAGYIGPREVHETRIRACLETMHHRGPDNAEYVQFIQNGRDNVYLLHTRLNIIDLDPRANQPFKINNRWIIFNGELYNFLEIRKELEGRGKTFSTTSDTEVLLQAIDTWGLSGLDRCEGMWAFAVYDENEGSLTLSRDRFGEKPLYFFRDETGFYFGSEIKFLSALSGQRFSINYDHLSRYLVQGYKALYKKNRTFFTDVHEVDPATVVSIGPGGLIHKETYWIPSFSPKEDMTYEEAVAGSRERLIRSVGLRLRSDVPLAFCMSGGVDSNSLISIAKRRFNYDVRGFTIYNTDPRYDEREMVAASVKELGIDHTPIPVNTNNFLSNIRELIRHHDAPVYTISYYAHWLLMQSIAEQGYRVSISGTAADELFSGYYDHHLMYLYEMRGDQDRYDQAKAEWLRYIYPEVRNQFLKDGDLFFRNPGFRDHIFDEADKFRTYLNKDWFEGFEEEKYCSDLMRNRMLNELFHEAIPVILHEDDLNAMFFSVENRSPFLDRNLFEFCYSIPTRHLIRGGAAKAILRDAMRGIVPDVILDQHRKVGFNAPIFSFLDVKDPKVREELLRPGPIFDIVQIGKIKELLEKDDLPNSESKFLFNFLNAKIFLELFASTIENSFGTSEYERR